MNEESRSATAEGAAIMRALRETQEEFAAALLGGGAHRFDRRLQVYRNNVFVSLLQALADVYPVLVRLVGRDYFDQAARRFVREHPSRSGNLHDFGSELPGFLGRLPEAASLPYLPDVAALEWAWHEAFHAGDAPALEAARRSGESWASGGRDARERAARVAVLLAIAVVLIGVGFVLGRWSAGRVGTRRCASVWWEASSATRAD